MIDESSISLLGAVIGVIMAAYTFVTYWIQRVRNQRTRATDLHSEFYGAEHYRLVVVPVYRMICKLRGLPEEQREAYRAMLAESWSYDPDREQELAYYVEKDELLKDPDVQHYRLKRSTEQYTEHDALVSFLYFWVRADQLINARLVDGKLFGKLFCNSFAYYDAFLDQLRADVRAANPAGQSPSWVDATERIEALTQRSRC